MISFQNVVKEFQLDKNTKITPVNKVNLTFADGEFIIILGRSGSGKTTLLNLAAGLVRPNSGQILLDDRNLGEMTEKQLSLMRSQHLGFVFQFPSLLSSLTVRENVSLPSIFKSGLRRVNANKRAEQLLDRLGLSGKLNVYPRQLSAGEQKRVVIARSLINEPQLILADEPTSDLDSRTEKEVMDILREINATGVTFLIVTHSLQLVPFATRAFEMQDGCLKEIQTSAIGQRA